MKILAFGHQKRVGKDQASKFIITALRLASQKKPLTIAKKAFADKLKSMCYELYAWAGLHNKDFYEEHPELKEVVLPILGKTPRQIWIDFGTLVGRHVYANTWGEYLLRTTKADILIITDLRFPEEAKMVQDHGGRVYKIVRPSIQHTPDLADNPLLDWTGWNGMLINHSDLQTFHDTVLREVMPWLQAV
jgi:hypothetical protein